ncbi:sugar 3,4-ketoisomerase [Flavobacterium collinsii]|uniref:TDP-4-oxo-6-deoxy-alpha-D-glucose-3, 4-oxoisomerase n=1 Tax=Flavobacterium collinsii TaxID=1114861 RepID=A0A9W4TCH2_9FLAO|nr:FdtA/QdtA family cupin domain-containing protein [Flavobacterium collinsii]CAA9200640.1 TDP-4-oxo-6-deoxy-alpha-D-glucose-3, 4-oxoisomerase [Flavobacterium collinsii]CAI2765422.1 TDP-4-oxo-6-deoxy-alpha-D-glucose-3, 4-oxoisomerase [Flavobacterium collinsii]
MTKIINLPKITDPRGNLTFLQYPNQIPFEIERTFWTYDVPGGEIRGGHAYHKQEEIIIALSGSFDVVITNLDGSVEKYSLNRSYYGLYLPAKTWRHIENFSTNSLALHISSDAFSKDDYIRDFEYLKKLSNE